MALKIYARHGGAAAATQDDITDRVPFLDGIPGTPIVQMGMSIQNGNASQGFLLVPDPTANDDASLYFPPHTQITMTEDATGDELVLAQGRIVGFTIGRAPGSEFDDAVEWTINVADANGDLRGLAFTEDWLRPVESGHQRLEALVAYTLNGTSSTRPDFDGKITYRPSTVIVLDGNAPDTNGVILPAKTYSAGTQPEEVVNDCANTEGKVWGIVPHHVAGVTHMCLEYIKESDHSTYASAAKISTELSDWDPDDPTAPVWEPWWDQGKGQRVDGTQNISGLVSRYGTDDKVIVSVDETLGDANEYWVDVYHDGDSVDPLQAANVASSIIAYRSPFSESDFCSIEILPEQHHLITAGMSIQVKAPPVNAGTYSTVGTYVDRRIVSLQWEPRANGKLHAVLQLNRPTRVGGVGRAQAASTSPTGAPDCGDTAPYAFALNVDDAGWTKVDDPDYDPPTQNVIPAYKAANVSASGSSAILGHGIEERIEEEFEPGVFYSHYTGCSITKDDYSPAEPEEMLFRFNWMELGNYNGPIVLSNTAFGSAELYPPFNVGAPPGSETDGRIAVYGGSSADYAWEVDQSYFLRISGGSGQVVSVWKVEDDEATATTATGTTAWAGGLNLGTFRVSNALDHDDDYTPSTVQIESLTVFQAIDDPFCLDDPGTSPYYAKSDDPRFDSIVTDHGGLSGLLDDDHTQYIKDSEFGAKGRILVGSGAGAFDDLPVGTNGYVLTADSAQTLGVKWDVGGTGSGPFEDEDTFIWKFIAPANQLTSTDLTAGMGLSSGEAFIGVGTDYFYVVGGKLYAVSGSELGFVFPTFASDPGGGDSEEGQVYYNTGSDKLRWYNGTVWADLGGGHTHVYSEVPSGTVNGINDTFTLAATPTSGTLRLYKNGLRQKAGAGNDYTLATATITFLTGNIPQTGDTLLADYE